MSILNIHPKHQAALDAIHRKSPDTRVPTRGYFADAAEKYYAEHAVEARRVEDSRCFKGEICLAFFDKSGDCVGGYFLRPDQEDYVLERILTK